MPGDQDYATRVLHSLREGGELSAEKFEINHRAGGNVARLLTVLLRSNLPGSEYLSAKTSRWKEGVIAFKNFTRNTKFWTKVTQNDLESDHDVRVWVCSSLNRDEATQHVWVLPFSVIRDHYESLPNDAQGRRDLKILEHNGVWSFRLDTAPEGGSDLSGFHTEFDLGQFDDFRQALIADSAKHEKDREDQPKTPKDAIDRPKESNSDAVDLVGSNQIYFGPPGTGKSHRLFEELGDARNEQQIETVTFHPEYTYADFVGTYRPDMVFTGTDKYFDAMCEPLKTPGRPSVIYRFVPGPLVRMVCRAIADPGSHYYLVIEEINRGNCAGIFGDFFHLLDRLEDGESKYAVTCEHELIAHIRQELSGLPQELRCRIDQEGVYLPSNLSVFATMNTSDQSLYPMDAAMKRRWEMRYIPINYDEARGRRVTISGYDEMDWGEVLQKVNREVVRCTHSDDKQIGQWFVRGRSISKDTFRDKLLSYLWFDVFRHNPRDIFDLRDKPYSYESLAMSYDSGMKVFKAGILDDDPKPPGDGTE